MTKGDLLPDPLVFLNRTAAARLLGVSVSFLAHRTDPRQGLPMCKFGRRTYYQIVPREVV